MAFYGGTLVTIIKNPAIKYGGCFNAKRQFENEKGNSDRRPVLWKSIFAVRFSKMRLNPKIIAIIGAVESEVIALKWFSVTWSCSPLDSFQYSHTVDGCLNSNFTERYFRNVIVKKVHRARH